MGAVSSSARDQFHSRYWRILMQSGWRIWWRGAPTIVRRWKSLFSPAYAGC